MGRAAVIIIFIIGFIVFAIAKAIFTGTKAAYNVIFDPNSKEEKIQAIVNDAMIRVDLAMHQKYKKQYGELQLLIAQLTLEVQSFVLEKGYNLPSNVAKQIVCEAIVIGGHATYEEINR